MQSGILIGIDIGSTVLKAAAFDMTSGRLLAQQGKRLKLHVGCDGAREQSSASLDRTLAGLLAGLRDKLRSNWSDVVGIGLAAQGGSTIIANRRTGKALTPVILWNDTRAARYSAHIAKHRSPAFWRRHTMRDMPGAGLGKILWLKDTRPSIMNDDNIYVGVGEFCYFKLTGLWRQDACNALQIGCYDATGRRLDQRLMDLSGMPLSFVAPLRNGHETHPVAPAAARRFALTPGIPVAGPYMDHEAGYLSAAGVSRKPLQCSLGTAWVGNFILSKKEEWSSPFQLVLPAVVGTGHLVVQPLLTGNVTLDWGLRQFVDADLQEALARLKTIFSQQLLPHPGLTAIPWLNVGNPLKPTVIGGAAFHGMAPHTNQEELMRALVASMTYEMARVFTNVTRTRRADSLVLGGGASRADFIRKLFASLFDPVPVHFVREQDLCVARGALHVFSKKVAQASVSRVRPPRKDLREQIQEGYENYMDLFTRLYGKVGLAKPITFG